MYTILCLEGQLELNLLWNSHLTNEYSSDTLVEETVGDGSFGFGLHHHRKGVERKNSPGEDTLLKETVGS